MTKVKNPINNDKENVEKNKDNSLTVNELKKDFDKNQSPLLSNLLKYNRPIIDAAKQDVIRRPALERVKNATQIRVYPLLVSYPNCLFYAVHLMKRCGLNFKKKPLESHLKLIIILQNFGLPTKVKNIEPLQEVN